MLPMLVATLLWVSSWPDTSVGAGGGGWLNSEASREFPPPHNGLGPADLAVIINLSDPLSVAIGEYYIRARHVPAANVGRVRFDPRRDEIPGDEFRALQASIDQTLGARVQAYALTWARPYRVGCISITSAFAMGLEPTYCASGCTATPVSPYYDAHTSRPYTELHIHPTMSIAANDFQAAKKLIDRGIQSDGRGQSGIAYLASTDDAPRNVRAVEYGRSALELRDRVPIRLIRDSPRQVAEDAMFYFVGAASVQQMGRIHFLPGALADHLTSFGGMLTDSPQMSSLRWLEAGATGSYGTVVEPCNFLGKFPNVTVAMSHYIAGETLIESYWKSVAMPAQGLFIGEPLAAPYRPRPAPGAPRAAAQAR
ncbi:MAG TPA: TIGR03790 family protein [Steroidobacteraceae bacterium]|jgi:uncharacterized protein (TIGR03790 family)